MTHRERRQGRVRLPGSRCARSGRRARHLAPGRRRPRRDQQGSGGIPYARCRRSGSGDTCHTMIVNAGSELLARAHQAQAVRPDVTITQLLKLVGAIALATEHDHDGAAEADRLLTLVIDGVHPRGMPERATSDVTGDDQ
ncbi:SbtR family transcriptional regulator [Streptomyces sp. QTS52]